MNQLTSNNNLTMSSREIAEYTGKEHKHVLRDIDGMLASLEILSGEYDQDWTHPQNKQTYRGYSLPKDLTITLVSGYSPKVRHEIVKRWIELESKANQPALPQSFAEALQLAADQAKQLELAAPKVAFVEKYVEAQTGNKTFRQVCKLLQIKENAFRAFLIEEKIMYRLGGEWAAYAQHIDTGRFATKTGVSDCGHAYNAANFTPKGIEWVAAKWAVYKLKGERL